MSSSDKQNFRPGGKRLFREQFPQLHITDIRPELLKNGARLRCRRRCPEYSFDVRRSQYDASRLTVFYRGEDLEVAWTGKGSKRKPFWFCGHCGALVKTMYRRRFYWLCLHCLENEVGPLARVTKDRLSAARCDLEMQQIRWRSGDFTTRVCDWPAMFLAPHVPKETFYALDDMFGALWKVKVRLFCESGRRAFGW